MRTAITLAKTHSGKWSLVSGPDVSMLEQKAEFRAFRPLKAHKDFAEVIYQENDGHRETIRLLTPKALAKLQNQNEADEAAAREFDEAAAKANQKDPERAKIEKEFKAKEAAAETAGEPAPGEVVTEAEPTENVTSENQ